MREKAELFHRSSLMSGLCALITLGLLCPLTADIKKILKKTPVLQRTYLSPRNNDLPNASKKKKISKWS